MEALAKPGVLARVFKERVVVPTAAEAVAGFLEAGEEHFLRRLGLGLRAGAVSVGSEGVAEVLGRTRVALLLTANDLGGAVFKKQAQLARGCGVAHFQFEGGGERIGQVLGRSFVGSLAVRSGPFGDDLLLWAGLLSAFPTSNFSRATAES